MADLFTRAEVGYGGAFHSQRGIITPVGGIDIGVLMQNLQLQYQQQVTRVYELGSAGLPTKCYYVAGRSQGTISAGHIVGPGVTLRAFYTKFSDVCNAACNTLELNLGPNVCTPQSGAQATENDFFNSIFGTDLSTGCFDTPDHPLTYTAKYCVLVAIGMSVQAQEFVINENSQIMFTGLEFNG